MFSAAPTALTRHAGAGGSPAGLSPSPSGLGSRLAVGPPGLGSMAILQCHSSLKETQASGFLGGMTRFKLVGKL